MDPIRSFQALSRTFGGRAARPKLRLLDALRPDRCRGARRLRQLHATLDFMRAYPDDARVLAAVRARIAASTPVEPPVYPYSYGVVRRLVRLLPGRLEIHWKAIEDETALLDTLDLLVTPGETQGLEDIRISTRDWFAACRPPGARTDLECFVRLLEGSGLSPALQAHLYERCDLPLRYAGPPPCEVELPAPRIHYQRAPLERGPFAIEPVIRQPIPALARGGQAVIDAALKALCARTLEIHPLIYADPAGVRVVDCGRGVRVALIGVLREFRSPLETLHVFLMVKNGVPVAYGPAAVFMGCCEMGMNLFPEFRGGEVRRLYAQLMRALHHVLAVDHFFVTRYGMGEGNDEAIESAAFWFYRRLGFRPTNPRVEALAREEEARMAARPGHRSGRRMLRRLSHTEACLDLSNGRRRPMDLGRLGVAQSRFIARTFGGDRALAERRCVARVRRLLDPGGDGWALRALSPLLCMIPDLPRWSRRERAALARIIRAKDAPCEIRAARLFGRHARLERALRALAESERGRAREPRARQHPDGGGGGRRARRNGGRDPGTSRKERA